MTPDPQASAAPSAAPKVKLPKPEIKTRICACCGQPYEYPTMKSQASRFHCDRCIALPADIRKVFEIMNKRLAKIEKASAPAAKPAAPPADPAPAKGED
jgi:hypothetical protein